MTAPVEQLQLVPIERCPTCGWQISDCVCMRRATPLSDDSQLEMLPEWDGTEPVPYGVIPF